MPELPEVETFCRYIESTAMHQTILELEIRNALVIKGTSEEALHRAVIGSQFEESARHGKHLLLRLSHGGWLTWHFGMTGEPVYARREEEEPRYVRLRFAFADSDLFFVDPRMLGLIGLTGSVEEFVRLKGLGPDALAVSRRAFREIIGSSRGAIKASLMDQHKLAGLGNIYTDEVLFRSHLDPRTDCRRLSPSDVDTLYQNTRRVLRMAISRHAEYEDYPDTSLLRSRRRGAPCPLCGGTVATVSVGGRTSYYCPACQSLR